MLKRLHRWNALALGVFLTLHFANHLFFLQGIEAHLTVLKSLRGFHRQPVLEPILLLLFAAQIGLGWVLARRSARNRSGWARAQRVSGYYMAVFLIIHVSAAFVARLFFDAIDSDSYWAVSVVSRLPISPLFALYYALGLFAVCVHIIAYPKIRRVLRRATKPALALSVVFSFGVVAAMMTAPEPMPEGNKAYLKTMYGID